MGKYQFTESWLLEASRHEVWNLIKDFEQLRCWQGVSFQRLQEGTSKNGIGDKYRMNMRTKLWYTISLDFVVTEKQEETLICLEAYGDLSGQGVFRLQESGAYTRLHYDWQVHTNKPWMQRWEPLLRPLFIWNHNRVMGEAVRGISNQLGARLV